MADTVPDPIPTEYHRAVYLLRRYVTLLHQTVGDRCGHHVEVRQIAAVLNNNQHVFEALDARQIASLLWQIFIDARRFFSAGMDIRNLLRTTFNEVSAGIVQAHLNVPYVALLGQDPGEASFSRESGEASKERATTGPRNFWHVPPAIKMILQGARSKYPTLTVADLMSAHQPPLQYAQVKLGPAGSCLDFMCFGSCKNRRCSYKHPTTASIASNLATTIAPKLGAAYTAYDAAQG
jgi:hypothetical protein